VCADGRRLVEATREAARHDVEVRAAGAAELCPEPPGVTRFVTRNGVDYNNSSRLLNAGM